MILFAHVPVPAARHVRHDRLPVLGRHRRLGHQRSRSPGPGTSSNFVFWIGIGHAGTLISAILFLFRQNWRTVDQPLRRSDDDLRGHLRRHLPGHPRRPRLAAPTACSRSRTRWACGRIPQPAALGRVRGLTYFTVSLLFWYIGLIPDLATLRDRATSQGPQVRLRHLRPRLARLATATGSTTRRPT